MRESVRLGRIAGVAVGIHWSLVVIFTLIAVSVAAGRLPDVHAGHSTAAYVTAGLLTALLFFASVLAHELSHAFVAQRQGIPVEGVVLWAFGGVARLEGDATDPRSALRIAVVGPLVSLLLGGAFLLLAVILADSGAQGLVGEAARWLGIVNLALGVFNLFPGAPLDGGRVLRALLWRVSGDRDRSWALAARVGRVVGLVMIGLGVLVFATGGVAGLWLVLIGWFLVNAARVEESQAELRGSLGDLRVAELMTPDPVAAPVGTTVQSFISDFVFHHRFSTFPVVDADGAVVGIANVGQVKWVPVDERGATTIEQVATPLRPEAFATADESVVDVLERQDPTGDGRVLVVEGTTLVGIISPRDVVHAVERAALRPGARGVLSR